MKIKINKNYLLSTVFINRLALLGVKHALISPGSRNTPLISALADNTKITKTVILDERSSAFFALGIAKQTNVPVLIVTTSGTAVAELYPAIVEAYQNRVPLIICTADRPPEALNCGTNQTINQDNIFANHIRNFYSFKYFDESESSIFALIEKTTEAYLTASSFDVGPVHINFPFEKPLEPDSYNLSLLKAEYDKIKFAISSPISTVETKQDIVTNKIAQIIERIKKVNNGIIVVGPGNYSEEFFEKCNTLAERLGYPIFPDALSSFRYFGAQKEFSLQSDFSTAFSQQDIFAYFYEKVDIIIQFGRTPTSKYFLQFFADSPAYKVLVNQHGELYDPSKTADLIIKIHEDKFIHSLLNDLDVSEIPYSSTILDPIIKLNSFISDFRNEFFDKASFVFEGKVVVETIKHLPYRANLVVSNSMPPRDMDYYTGINENKTTVYSNRGASGIDGNNATAAGIAFSSSQRTFFITGDLSFLHDIGSLLFIKQYNIPLCIILINNNGGGIFNMLPISENNKIFEQYFLTPHNQNIKDITTGFGIKHIIIDNLSTLVDEINLFNSDPMPKVLEIRTNSTSSAFLRNSYKLKVHNAIKNFFITNIH